MTRRVTALLAGLLLMTSGTAVSQNTVSVRDINLVAQDSVDALKAGGTALSLTDIDRLVQSSLDGDTVIVTAVLLTDPFLSGLRSVDNPGTPDEKVPIHAFVRDTSAASLGNGGMGIQIFSGEPATSKLADATFGDVITVLGIVDYFSGGQIQFEALDVDVQGNYSLFPNLTDDIIAPMVVTTSDVNAAIDVGGVGEVQANWDNFNSLNGQFVRIENAKVLERTLTETSNPHILISSDNGVTYIQFDTRYSVRYNNSRINSYPPAFLTRPDTDPFVPPAIGSTVNVQGFVFYQSTSFEFSTFSAEPNGAWLALAPFFDSDLEVVAQPSVTRVSGNPITSVPGADPVPVTATVEAEPGAIATVFVDYSASTGESGSVAMADQGANTWGADIPALPDGAFVTFTISVRDTENILFESDNEVVYRVLVDGINEIEDIQLTPDGLEGPSVFADIETGMNIMGLINSRPDSSGWYILQDDIAGGPWSGIILEDTSGANLLGLGPGDLVSVTAGTIVEIRGGFRFDRSGDVTGIANPAIGLVTPGAGVQTYKTVTTDLLQDPSTAEGHESMMLRFENVVVTTNQADGDRDFGEWAVSSDGTEDNQVRVDDASPLIPSPPSSTPPGGGFNSDIVPGSVYSFHQGVWSNAFGYFKLMPEDLSDIGEVTNVSNETLDVPDRFALEQNYPNPFNPSTTIAFDVGTTAKVTLEVFDILGRRVAVLADREYAAGSYTAIFDAKDLASGMYIYQLTAGSEILTKSMMLLK